MPIEIKELHIKVTVNAPTAPDKATVAAPPKTGNGSNGTAADKEAIVAECVEQVLQILQEKHER